MLKVVIDHVFQTLKLSKHSTDFGSQMAIVVWTHTLVVQTDLENQAAQEEVIEMMTVIDIVLIIGIVMMAWGMQSAGAQTELTGLRSQTSNSAEDALSMVRMIRGSNRDELQEQRLQGYRSAVAQSEQRIGEHEVAIDNAVKSLESAIESRSIAIAEIQDQHERTVYIQSMVVELESFVQDLLASHKFDANKTRSEANNLEDRIRDLEGQISSTNQQLEDLCIKTGAYHP